MDSPPPDPLRPGDSASFGLHRGSLQRLAARVLILFIGGLGGVVALSGLLELAGLFHSTQGLHRTVFGGALMAAALAARLAQRLHSPAAANAVVLLGALLALALMAVGTGLGVHTVALAGVGVLVALAGGLSGLLGASLLAGFYLVVVAVLAALEHHAALPGLAAAAHLTLSDRVTGHVLLAAGAWLAAVLLSRVVGAALAQSLSEQQRLAHLVRAAHNWDWEADPHFILTHLSDNFSALTGHSREEFLRLGLPGGPTPVLDENHAAMLADVRARRAYRDRVQTFRALDGRLIWALSSGEPVFDKTGRHTGWRGVSHDITTERQAQAEHRRTADLLDRLVRASPDAICVASLADGRVLFCNAGFLGLVGLSEAEVMGRSAVELGLWPDLGEAARLRTALAAQGLVRDHRSYLQLADRRRREVLFSAAGFHWDGQPVAAIISRDITELERARIEADAILDNASVGIALTRGERFERFNPQWRQIFGGPEPWLAEGAAPLPTAREIAVAAQAFEREFTCPDSRRITVQINARGLADAEATLWVAEDITARRAAERELQAAKQQAEAASHAKSAFLATMSHEIRTPLNGVLGLARLLQQPGLDDSRRASYLAHLAGAAESLNEIVSNVLDLSKIEAGHLALERLEFDLHALARASFEGSAALGRERGLHMSLSLAEGLPRRVIGDPLRLRQILANLLGNALKFTERGRISLSLAPAGPGRVRIGVQDSGIGIPPEQQSRLFMPFAQADNSTTRRFGGTGLGLSICRELAERMDGSVGVDSDGRSGSHFWAELALPTAQAAEPAPARSPRRYPLAGLRLLVAEDNPVNRLIMTALLQRLGAEVLEAEDGEQAVKLAREQAQRLDAVLMDLHMPKIDGLRATALLRADPATARLPIHAFSAAVLDQERQAALAAGMDGFITKPVAEIEVVRVLGRS